MIKETKLSQNHTVILAQLFVISIKKTKQNKQFLSPNSNQNHEIQTKLTTTLTRRVLDASKTTPEGLPGWSTVGGAAVAEEDKQSATARRRGSGGFFTDEDLNLETPPTPPPNPSC